MEEKNIEKAVKTENFMRALTEISHLLHKYDFDVYEAVTVLSTGLTTGFLQMFENGTSLETIKRMVNELSEEMYKTLKKTTQNKEK